MKLWDCVLFIDDGFELDTIVEGEIRAKTAEKAVSILLSEEGRRRKMPYYWLKERVIDSLAKKRITKRNPRENK